MAASGYMLRLNGDVSLVFPGEMSTDESKVRYEFTVPDTVGKVVVEKLELLDEAGDVLAWREVVPLQLHPKLQLQVRWNVDFRLETVTITPEKKKVEPTT